MATSLILTHENTQPGPVNLLDPLIDPGPSHATGASPYRQLALPNVVLDLAKLFILTLQLLLVDPVALHLSQGALVVEVVHRTVDFGVQVMVVLKEFELTRGVSAEWACRWDRGGLEGLNVLVRVPAYHTVYQGVFSILEFDVLGWFHFPTEKADVEGNIVGPFI